MPRESVIVSNIVRAAKQLGWWSMKLHGGPHQLAGVPDLLCLRDGRAVFLEVKQPGNKPTKLQELRMREIEQQGGAPCAVVTSREEASAVLRTHQGREGRDALDPALGRSERRAVRRV